MKNARRIDIDFFSCFYCFIFYVYVVYRIITQGWSFEYSSAQNQLSVKDAAELNLFLIVLHSNNPGSLTIKRHLACTDRRYYFIFNSCAT